MEEVVEDMVDDLLQEGEEIELVNAGGNEKMTMIEVGMPERKSEFKRAVNVHFDDENPETPHPISFKEKMIARYGPVPFHEGLPPMSLLPSILFSELKNNWKAGLTVALVNIPLSISLAVAAGGTPMQGIATSAWAGVIFGLFGGCEYNILGPTGALSGLLMLYSIRYGGPQILSFLALTSGLLLMLVLLLRLDRYLMFIPQSVVHGFTVGVALIIALGQLSYALGITGLVVEESFYMNVFNIFTHIDKTNPFALLVSFMTVASLLVLINFFPRVPWNVVLAAVGILFGWLLMEGHLPMDESVRILTLKDKFHDIDENFFRVVKVDPDWLSWSNAKDLFLASFNIMFVAALETLISAKIASDLTLSVFNQTWEMFGLSLSNLLSGIFGGLPCTAALARTALNVKSGATSRASSILNGVVVLLISLVIMKFFVYLLQPVVAGIVIVVAIKMVEYHSIISMWKNDKGSFFVGFLTVLVCVFDNPTDAIMVGTVISLLRLARYTSQLEAGNVSLDAVEIFVPIEISTGTHDEFHPTSSECPRYREGKVLLFTIPGNLTFLNAESYITKTQRLRNKFKYVIISMRMLAYIDLDGVMALSDIVNMLEKKGTGQKVLISGLKYELSHYSILSHSLWFQNKLKKGEIFSHYTEALDYLKKLDNTIEENWAELSTNPENLELAGRANEIHL